MDSVRATDVVDVVLAARATQADEDRFFFAMTPAQRVAAMWRTMQRDGRPGVRLRTLYRWACRYPHEVPLINGELPWIATRTTEYAERRARFPVSVGPSLRPAALADQAREWLGDLDWPDPLRDDAAELSGADALRAIEHRYPGGLREFVADLDPDDRP
jgi:hypothetical protein